MSVKHPTQLKDIFSLKNVAGTVLVSWLVWLTFSLVLVKNFAPQSTGECKVIDQENATVFCVGASVILVQMWTFLGVQCCTLHHLKKMRRNAIPTFASQRVAWRKKTNKVSRYTSQSIHGRKYFFNHFELSVQ